MRTRIYSILLGLTLLGAILSRCKNPLDDVQLAVDTNVFQYTTLVEVKSSAGTPIGSNATVTITGRDADKIYNLAGKKEFQVAGGLLGLGVSPNVTIADGTNLQFTVNVSAPGHLPIAIPVTIAKESKASIMDATMLNIANPPEGVKVETKTVPLATNGAVTTNTTLTTATNAEVTETVSVGLTAGTQFKDASGNTITGGNLSVSTVAANTGNNDALAIFPGGSLTLPEIKTNTGATVSGTLMPAALTEISMNAGNTAIRTFTQPVNIGLQLDPDFVNPVTGAKVKVGDVLEVYSFSASNNMWSYENQGTVANVGGKLTVNTSTTHLSWFMVGARLASCGAFGPSIQITAPWLTSGITHPIVYRTYSMFGSLRDKLLSSSAFTVTNGDLVRLPLALPSISVTLVAFDAAGNELYTAPFGSCITQINSILNISPIVSNNRVDMQLYVRCPGKTEPIALLPTFYLYYKETGAPQADYKLLGIVNKGNISTTLLNTSKRYDFKAIWNNTVKEVNNKAVQASNSTTVGDGSGENLGSSGRVNNLEMLIEKCNETGN